MFGKNHHGTESRGDFPDEAGVLGEPFDVSFVATVEENWAQTLRAHPVLGADKVTLRERGKVGEAEVVEALLEVSGFVVELRWLGTVWCCREFSKESRCMFRRKWLR